MFQTHSSVALDKEMLTLAKTAGCAVFGYGIESASPRVLESMNKKSKLENIIEAIKLSESVGIGFGGNFIFGDPAEDLATIRETMDYFWKYCTRMLVFIGQIHLYPGSLIFMQSIERGLIRDKKDYYNRIDECVCNMTALPTRVWYPWISLLFYFASKMPWVHSGEAVLVEPDMGSGQGRAQLPVGIAFYNITAVCPHCGRKAVYREALPGDARGAKARPSWFRQIKRIVFSPTERLNRFRMKAAIVSVLYLLTSFRHPIFGLLRPFMKCPVAGVSFVTVCLHCGRLMRVVVPQLSKTPLRSSLIDRIAIPLLKRLFPVAPPPQE